MNRRCIVIRRQHPHHPRPGNPMRWIAVCQHCGVGCIRDHHAEAITWADQHVHYPAVTNQADRVLAFARTMGLQLDGWQQRTIRALLRTDS